MPFESVDARTKADARDCGGVACLWLANAARTNYITLDKSCYQVSNGFYGLLRANFIWTDYIPSQPDNAISRTVNERRREKTRPACLRKPAC